MDPEMKSNPKKKLGTNRLGKGSKNFKSKTKMCHCYSQGYNESLKQKSDNM
jgi:hypothetical protein